MDLSLVASQSDDTAWYRAQLDAKLGAVDASLLRNDVWTNSLVKNIIYFTNDHFYKRSVIDFSSTPTLMKLELKWHLCNILSDERYNARSKMERRKSPMEWYSKNGNQILEHFSATCVANIPHPAFPLSGMTSPSGTKAHNKELLEFYSSCRETSPHKEVKRTYVKRGTLTSRRYQSPRITMAGDIHKKIIIGREQLKTLENRNIVLFNDLYSEDDRRFKDKQRNSDCALNFYLFPLWMRSVVKKHILIKIEHDELAPSTLSNYFNRLTKFRDFMYETFEQPSPELITTTLLEDNYIAWGNAKGYTGKNWFTDVVAFLSTATKYNPELWPSVSVSQRAARKISKTHYKNGLGRLGHNQESAIRLYSSSEVDQLAYICRKCAHPIQHIFTLILATGIRSEDGHAILYDCLEEDPNDSDFMLLTFWQNKVRKWNIKPLLKSDPAHAELISSIEQQRKYVVNKYSRPTKYLFPQFSGSKESFIEKSYTAAEIKFQCATYNIQRDDGTKLSFHWHALRHTKGSSMARDGHDILSIMMELGHTSPDMATVYINNRLELKKNALMKHGGGRFFTIEGEVDNQISTLLARKADIKATRVSGGACSMPAQVGDWCSHANACYSCKHFRADEKDVEFFRREKEELDNVMNNQENEIVDLTNNGQTRMTEITRKRLRQNKLVFKSLNTIVNAIEENGEYQGKNSNSVRVEL